MDKEVKTGKVEEVLIQITKHREEFGNFLEKEWHPHKMENKNAHRRVEEMHNSYLSLPAILAPYSTVPSDLREMKSSLLTAATQDRKPSNGVPVSVVLMIIFSTSIVFAVPLLIDKMNTAKGSLELSKDSLKIHTNEIKVLPPNLAITPTPTPTK